MMMGNLLQIPPVRLLASERAVFRGRPRYSTLEWAQKHMRIVHGPCKGQKWDAELTPYAKGVFEIFDRENVRKLFLIASSQVAKTTMALICLFAEQCRRQENMGFGYPDQLAARKIMTGIVHPYYKAIAPLRGMLSGDDALQNYETVHRDGSRIYAMWAGSDSSTRSISMGPRAHRRRGLGGGQIGCSGHAGARHGVRGDGPVQNYPLLPSQRYGKGVDDLVRRAERGTGMDAF